MKIISSIALFVLFTAVLGQDGENNGTSTSQSTTIVTETSASDITTPTTLETTTLESTSTSDVTTPTTIPTTASSSTTSSTSSSTASSTTEAPIPTSSAVPSTTKAPEPEKCYFNGTEGNVTCIQAEIQADFLIHVDGKTYSVMLGCEASYIGSKCSSNDTQTLVLSESTYNLTMVFEKDSGKVLVKNVTFSYNLPGVPKGTFSNYSEDLFDVKAGNSYKCKSKFDIHLENVTMEIHEIHIQAFLEEGKSYGAVEECEADEKVNDIVPIAVGVALAALIIIVLIAYLVGRRRSRQKGYQSV